MSDTVLVLGSANLDLIASVARLPTPGETVLSSQLVRRPGGKGANQAAAVARAGVRCVFVGAVGDDSDGSAQLAALSASEVDIRHAAVIADTPTGAALITLTPDGENSIVVAPGANRRLTVDHVLQTLNAVRPAVVLAQTEIAREVVEAAAYWSAQHQVRFILNNGPVVDLEPAVIAQADPLVVNEHEARTMLGTGAEPSDLARDLQQKTTAASVIVTLGAAGVLVAQPGAATFVPAAVAEDVVNTVGAGDAFVGTLAAELLRGHTILVAVAAAARAGAQAVAWHGARPEKVREELPAC